MIVRKGWTLDNDRSKTGHWTREFINGSESVRTVQQSVENWCTSPLATMVCENLAKIHRHTSRTPPVVPCIPLCAARPTARYAREHTSREVRESGRVCALHSMGTNVVFDHFFGKFTFFFFLGLPAVTITRRFGCSCCTCHKRCSHTLRSTPCAHVWKRRIGK